MACDPQTLMAKAGCLNCFNRIQLKLCQIEILRFGAFDSTSLQNNARCLASCGWGTLQAMKVWLLAQAGPQLTPVSTDPTVLLPLAQCVTCLTDYEMELALTVLIAQKGTPLPKTVDDFKTLITCTESCISNGMLDAIIVYLLTVLAAVSSDVDFLASKISCLQCLTPNQLKAIEVYLWCLLQPGFA